MSLVTASLPPLLITHYSAIYFGLARLTSLCHHLLPPSSPTENNGTLPPLLPWSLPCIFGVILSAQPITYIFTRLNPLLFISVNPNQTSDSTVLSAHTQCSVKYKDATVESLTYSVKLCALCKFHSSIFFVELNILDIVNE